MSKTFHFVETQAGLAEIARKLEGARELGVDAEMNGLHAFRARVCVLQIATDDLDVIVDTVKVTDIRPLESALIGAGPVRYAHGAAHDVKCLKQDFGIGLGGLFDTYVAAQLLGLEKLGYGDIVSQRFGIALDKGLQTADWGRRPLTDPQMAYLKNDIRYLIELGRQLQAELVAKDLVEEAQYEFGRVAALPADEDRLADDAYLKPKESRELPPAGLAILREVFLVRDAFARKLDKPPFKIAGEKTLVDIAKARPATPEELAKIQGLPRHAPPRLTSELLSAVQRGIDAGAPPPRKTSPQPRVDGEEIRARRHREEALRGWRKKIAIAKTLPPMAVLPSYTLDELVRLPAKNAEDLASRPGMIPKRMRLYGEEILALFRAPQPPAHTPAP